MEHLHQPTHSRDIQGRSVDVEKWHSSVSISKERPRTEHITYEGFRGTLGKRQGNETL